MKIYYLYFVSILLFISCDSSERAQEELTDKVSTYSKKNYDLPFNASNRFDYSGQIHNELLISYYEQLPLPTSIDSIFKRIELKAKEHPYFNTLPNASSLAISATQIAFITSSPEDALTDFLATSSFSTSAKNSLHYFISGLILLVETDVSYDVIYEHITAYESQVASELLYSSNEKSSILAVTSIVRHSIYMKKKKPKKNTDLDWDWLTTNIIGATIGASGDTPNAILTALAAGIVANK